MRLTRWNMDCQRQVRSTTTKFESIHGWVGDNEKNVGPLLPRGRVLRSGRSGYSGSSSGGSMYC